MKVYIDFEELDVEDRPTYICNKYNLQVKSINSGTRYDNVKLVSLADYTKQVRKEVVQEITELAKNKFEFLICDECYNTIDKDVYISSVELTKILDQIQGND